MIRIKRLFPVLGFVSAILLAFAALASAAEQKGLVDVLVSKLGVTKDQAAGGAGSILGYAKGNMKKDDFKKVVSAVPETNQLIKTAPRADTGSPTLGGLGSTQVAGSGLGTAGGLGSTAALAGSFQKLGLKSDMVGKFIPIVVDYAQSKGGSSVGSLLSGALGIGGK